MDQWLSKFIYQYIYLTSWLCVIDRTKLDVDTREKTMPLTSIYQSNISLSIFIIVHINRLTLRTVFVDNGCKFNNLLWIQILFLLGANFLSSHTCVVNVAPWIHSCTVRCGSYYKGSPINCVTRFLLLLKPSPRPGHTFIHLSWCDVTHFLNLCMY